MCVILRRTPYPRLPIGPSFERTGRLASEEVVPVERFELPNPKEVIYSHPHLAALLYWRGASGIDIAIAAGTLPGAIGDIFAVGELGSFRCCKW